MYVIIHVMDDTEFIDLVSNSTSYRNLLERMSEQGFRTSHSVVKNRVTSLDIDTAHFKGKASNKNKSPANKLTVERFLETVLVNNGPNWGTVKIKNRLFQLGLKEQKCENCTIGPMWNGKRLVLQLDHINGNRADNRLENLRVLCPNCHTQTETHSVNKEH